MKTSKKIWLGVSAVLYLLTLLVVLFPAHRALAATATSPQDVIDCGNSLSFVSIAEIDCTVQGQTVKFTDHDPSDNGVGSNDYYNVNYAPTDSTFCSKGIDGLQSTKFESQSDYYHTGITRRGSTNNFTLSDAGQPINVKLNVGYIDLATNNCTRIDSSHQDYTIPSAQTKGISTLLQFSSDGSLISSLAPVNKDALSSKSYQLVGQYTYGSSTIAYTQGFTAGNCGGEVVMFSQSAGVANRYVLYSDSPSASQWASYPALKDFLTHENVSNCFIHESQTNFGLGGSFNVAGTPPTQDVINQTQTLQQASSNGGGGTPSSSCESNFNYGFEWIVCPFLKMLDDSANALNGFVEDQLTVCTGNSSTTGQSCANNILTTQVYNAWAIFRDIASALLVLVMLAMVFSQAMGGGLLDAYSLRKMLPRLVAAVILMQLSWVILKFAVDVSNDLGVGIRDLMFAPFGGASNMTLQGLVGNSVKVHSTGTNDTFSFFFVLAGGTLLLSNPIGLLSLGFFVFVSLLTAFLVLVLRKLFIIMLIILAPVALVLWILPNTEKYWKMWSSNFSKLLAMYPLIMGLIAAGRIFAYITSTTNGKGVTSFADLAIVLFAFFAPYLMLPKAFSWGGSMMSAAAGQVQNRLQKPLMDKGKEGFKGMTERYQGRMGKAYDPNANIGKRILYRVGSGHYNPLPGPFGGARSQRLAIQAGDKWSQEQDEQAGAKIKRMGEKVLSEGYDTFERNDDGEMVDAAGNVVTDKAQAAVKHLTGVAAMKQMWVDLSEDGDKYEKKMAVRQLTATSSWPEIQGSFTKSGKRAIDTDAWADSITTSPEDYPRVLRSRVDATPHIDNAAKKALQEQLRINPGMSDVEQRRFVSAFRVQYSIEKQLDNEGFATQSDGYWEEVARMAQAGITYVDPSTGATVDLSQQIKDSLNERFKAIHDAGPTARQQMLGHLANGGKLEEYVNQALGVGAVTGMGAGHAAGPGAATVLDYMQP